jgi:hypothetical protein
MSSSGSGLSLSDLMMQQQLTQAAFQQKQLEANIRTMSGKDDATLREALQDDSPAVRFAAAYAVGEKRLPYTKELIQLLSDKTPMVRQAARRSLVLLSYEVDVVKKSNAKGVRPKAVDFGPMPASSASSAKAAAKKWQSWMEQNQNYLPSPSK